MIASVKLGLLIARLKLLRPFKAFTIYRADQSKPCCRQRKTILSELMWFDKDALT